MEAENSNFVKKKRLHKEEVNLEAYRRRYSNLVLAFKLFFICLTLITVAIITYLFQSEALDESIHNNPPSLQIDNPIATTESEIFNLSLQRAAQELELAASLILNSSASSEAKSELAFSRCREWLPIGSGQLREVIRSNPFPKRPSNQQRVEMANRIVAAEENINSCLGDLAAMQSSAAVDEVWTAVGGAAAYLGERGDFLMSYRDKMWRSLLETASSVVQFNLIVVCLFGLQMFFIFFLFWNIIKSG